MKEQLQNRLLALKAEYEAGQKVLANLEVQKANLRETLLRISGAMQVIEEELAIANTTPAPPPPPVAPERLTVSANGTSSHPNN